MSLAMGNPVWVEAAADGTLVYRIDHAPGDLPPVRGRDILAAWDSASAASQGVARNVSRAFLFDSPDGRQVNLAVTDREARCWAGAADRLIAMHTSYGLSVFLRLLALMEILVRCADGAWLRDVREAAERHPRLLRLAAEARLTDDAGFELSRFLPCFSARAATDGPTGAPPP